MTQKKMTVSQVKVGDYLVRTGDHLGRPNARHKVTEVYTKDGRKFRLAGHWSNHLMTPGSLTAENLNHVERNGEVIGYFFVKYW